VEIKNKQLIINNKLNYPILNLQRCKGCEAKSKTIDSIKNRINKIKKMKHTFKYNHFQKFIADCYNKNIDNIVLIKHKDIKKKRVYKGSEYIFS